ncbi:substrate-binding domain-containing protein [uncultured Aeromicrobium sp.]|uniref:substrate-binding domain-containing protein n=1 Tax=uncultured Aeromicrobium sp. TaxID=337820 RepID=UPI0025F511B7|nr:substrate-binding domain-containing protein [uncultured Aeromicrobium sp.]
MNRQETIRVALVIPLQGPAGIFGPSCEAVADTALRLINEEPVLGRPMSVEVVDGGAPPHVVASRLRALVDRGEVDAVTGWHISAVRHALAPVVSDRLPYVYTSLYEGGETRPGIFCSGETPTDQIRPALRWLRDELGLRRWFIVGDDYIWPRASASVTQQFAHDLDLTLSGIAYVKLGTTDFSQVLDAVRRSGCQGVLLYLVGQDAVQFNRAFATAAGMDHLVRFSPLMEENMLLASGLAGTDNLYVAAAYFRSLATASALELGRRYVADHGPDAPPLNNAAESCFEGLVTLAHLARRSRSLDVRQMVARAEGVGFDGPRGAMSMTRAHLQQRVHLAKASDFDFDVVAPLGP